MENWFRVCRTIEKCLDLDSFARTSCRAFFRMNDVRISIRCHARRLIQLNASHCSTTCVAYESLDIQTIPFFCIFFHLQWISTDLCAREHYRKITKNTIFSVGKKGFSLLKIYKKNGYKERPLQNQAQVENVIGSCDKTQSKAHRTHVSPSNKSTSFLGNSILDVGRSNHTVFTFDCVEFIHMPTKIRAQIHNIFTENYWASIRFISLPCQSLRNFSHWSVLFVLMQKNRVKLYENAIREKRNYHQHSCVA